MSIARIIKRNAEAKEHRESEKSDEPTANTTNTNHIIPEKNTAYVADAPGALKLLQNMISALTEVDLVETLTNHVGDELVKYQVKSSNEDGHEAYAVSKTKVPRALYIVAILEELKIASVKYNFSMAQQNEMLYLYNGQYWVRVEDDDIKTFLGRAAIKLGYYSPADAMTHGFADAAYKQFIISSYLPVPEHNRNVVLINLQNGTYEITAEGGTLREHRKEDFLTYCLPFAHNPSAEAPVFEQYLKRVLPDAGSRLVLQEFHGYIFIKHLKLEKALILYGGGQNGKSVQFEITSALLGENNVATKSLGDLVDRDSGNDNRAKLKDKLVNYGSEIRSSGIDVDIFKRLVSGEPVSAREKYKTSFDLRNNCKFIFNANKLPAEIEHTEAYFRRFIIIPYDVMIPDSEKDPELHTKIISNELPGVLNWVIDGLYRLLQNKAFSECEAANKALGTYKRESNSVAMMLEEEGYIDGNTVEKEYHTSNKVIYETYRKYCSESGMRPQRKVNFLKEMKKLGYGTYRSGKERGFVLKRED